MVQVQLKSFRIQNYRSIIDSGWKNLATDNITILIGQNESGKTSILEALKSFYSGLIVEDILRSDQSMPIVSCGFSIEEGKLLSDVINFQKLPNELTKQIEAKKTFYLTREWFPDKTSKVYVSQDEIYEYYNTIECEENALELKIIDQIDVILNASKKLYAELGLAEEEKKIEQQKLTEKRKVQEEFTKALKKARKPDLKLIAENDLKHAASEYSTQEEKYLNKVEKYDKLSIDVNKNSDKTTICNKCKQLFNEYEELLALRSEAQDDVLDYRHFYEISTSFKDQKKNKLKLDNATRKLTVLSSKLKNAYDARSFHLKVAGIILNDDKDVGIKAAEYQVQNILSDRESYYSLFDLGEQLMEIIPVFEFFEDFSGLLPNKIDLEDIINEHEHIEGYKAARNFLNLAGLNPSFFREKNQRVLKQRIATLNSDISVNFQDYWSQNVGKGSKIKLHFELEHYDYTVPAKSGKPYLEFWIKDKKERLYPKQRSRGVRWFLSFYLELKAAESISKGNRVLLIDEPGLSLHAKAQEDVLKVFEDLKDSMQIVYCTHSPHLVNTEKLYRVLAVQRATDTDDKSETTVFEPTSLNKASADTLTPIYSLMGIRLSDQQFINKSNNIILPDTATYYYMHWLSKLFPKAKEINFIPSTNTESLPMLINILEGWNLDYAVLILGKDKSGVINSITTNTLLEDNTKNKILHTLKFNAIEDIFSTLDFKKYVLLKREGITDTNSRYIKANNLSRKILATNFVNNFNENKFTIDNFDETSKKNIIELFELLLK